MILDRYKNFVSDPLLERHAPGSPFIPARGQIVVCQNSEVLWEFPDLHFRRLIATRGNFYSRADCFTLYRYVLWPPDRLDSKKYTLAGRRLCK